jgi:hypothetical protein
MKIGYALGLLVGLYPAASMSAPGGVATVEQCARNPDLFRMSRISEAQAERLFRRMPGREASLGRPLIQGYVLAGECGRYVVKASPTVRLDLSNGAAFVAQVPGYRLLPVKSEPYISSAFTPPADLITIASSAPGIRGPLHYTDSRDTGSGLRLAIWSGRNGSVLGTIDCRAAGAEEHCSMGQVFHASPYQFRELRYVPMPHPELSGSVALWITLPGSRQAFVDYPISLGSGFSTARRK